jgi:competence protein ComEA
MVTPSPSPPATTTRRAQVALGVFLALLFGLLAFRGYGNWLGAKPTEPARAALTDLNHAGRAELEQIPGIGPGLAKQIDDHRRAKGPFKSVEELRQVKGIGPATFDKVRAFVRVDPQPTPAEPPLEPLVLERKPAPPSVPAPYPRSGSAGSKLQPGDPPIDVNAAGVAELMRLPGVGPVTAQNIVNARAEKPFASVADLDRVKGIGPKTLDKIRPFVVVK